ncbi:hypothetical protein MLD38_034238 [Melastoma candidum]|uniref:Uncharacterized protein n=1 Tax=Melastoma candidum TaxID=119954 RepID=A0ACB9M9W6_9MYRT|nr:hypothetical protein MLD38_034238 [Melastoma candidum]
MATPKALLILAVLALSATIICALGEAPDTTLEEYDAEEAMLEEETAEEETPANDWLSLFPFRRVLAHSNNGRTSVCSKDNKKCKHHADDDENNEHQHHKYRCCKKKCIDMSGDKNHCGHCNKRCVYSKTCCRGKCVWLTSNRKHCGSCNNRCPKDVKCVLGSCNYAS